MSSPYTEVNDNVIDYVTIDCRASRRKGKEMSETPKKSLMDSLTDFVNKLAVPLGKFGMLPPIAAVQNGMIAAMPVIMVGAAFLIFFILGSPSVGEGGALLPFLEPYANAFVNMNSLTLGLMGLYCSLTIAQAYAEKLGVDVKSAGLLGLAAFIIVTTGSEGIDANSWSASGLFVAIVTVLLSVWIYSFFLKKGFTIKMPDSVPPAIGNSFASVVPYAVCMGVCWFIRTLLNIDVVAVLMGLLTPLVAGADNIFVATGSTFLAQLLWAVGLHGDNMFFVNFTPFGLMWIEENAAALAQGTSIYELPHILGGLGAGGGLQRMMIWTAAAWPPIFLMLTSKVKYHKTLGIACLPPAIFTVVEPVVFGLPLALNPYLMIPFILSATVSMAVGYGLTMVGFFGRFFAALPWATPPFLLGPSAPATSRRRCSP